MIRTIIKVAKFYVKGSSLGSWTPTHIYRYLHIQTYMHLSYSTLSRTLSLFRPSRVPLLSFLLQKNARVKARTLIFFVRLSPSPVHLFIFKNHWPQLRTRFADFGREKSHPNLMRIKRYHIESGFSRVGSHLACFSFHSPINFPSPGQTAIWIQTFTFCYKYMVLSTTSNRKSNQITNRVKMKKIRLVVWFGLILVLDKKPGLHLSWFGFN